MPDPEKKLPQDDLEAAAGDVLRGQVDRALEAGAAGWWSSLDESQKFAVGALGFAAAIGPIGQGLVAALGSLFKPAIPSSTQVEAVFWLFLITLPLAAGVLVFVLAAGRGPLGGVLAFTGGVTFIAGAAMASIAIPDKLGDFYCYADFSGGAIVYEQQCRDFDSLGFVTQTHDIAGSASGAPEVVGWAFVYVADARGFVMAMASVIAAVAAGYLIRREMDSNP